MIVFIVLATSIGLFGLAAAVAVQGYHEQLQQFDVEATARQEGQRLRQLEADATRQIQHLTCEAYNQMLTETQRARFSKGSQSAQTVEHP